jgi:hypothetical protein
VAPVLATVEVKLLSEYSAAPVSRQTPVSPPQPQPHDWQEGAGIRRGVGRQGTAGPQPELLLDEDEELLLLDDEDELLDDEDELLGEDELL